MTPPRWKLFTPLVDGQMAFKAPIFGEPSQAEIRA
jgi:hypothetical protein